MMSKKPILFVIAASVLVAGCATDPKNYESAPVSVETSKGTVVCQLYTRDLVAWDRAIEVPQKMSISEGDTICRAEGQRWKDSA